MHTAASPHNPINHARPYRSWTALSYWLLWAYDGPVPDRAHVAYSGKPSLPEFTCWLIRQGKVKVEANGHTVQAHSGQWVFVATDRRHQIFSSDIEILSLRVHLSWPGNEPVIEQRHSYVVNASDYPELERTARPLIRSVQTRFPKAIADLHEGDCSLLAYMHVQNLLPRWLNNYLRIQGENGIQPRWMEIVDSRIQQAMMELDRHPLHRPFSEKWLTETIGLSQSRLNTLFAQATGTTPKRYFDNRRLDAAKHLLASTTMSIKEIAYNLGFRYDSHFTQWFNRRMGQTPSELRITPKTSL